MPYLAPLFGEQGTTDWTKQITDTIAKVSTVNPEAGTMLATAYGSRTNGSSGFLSGLWNTLTVPFRAAIEGFTRFQSALTEPFRNETEGPDAQAEADPFWVDVWQGLTGKERTSWSRNLASYGMAEDSWVRGVLGLTLDIALDPTTYVTGGLQGVVKTAAAKTAKNVTESGVRSAFANATFEELVSKGAKRDLLANGVSDDAVDALAGMALDGATRTLSKTVQSVVDKEASWLGTVMGDAVWQRGSVSALAGDLVSPVTGKVWTKTEREVFLRDLAAMSPRQLDELGARHLGIDVGDIPASRRAAAALGGTRMRLALPFGRRLADLWKTPWLGYRWQTGSTLGSYFGWQTHALRDQLAKRSPKVADWVDPGNFFRGVAGMHRIDNAIQQGLMEPEDLKVFLRARDDKGVGGLAGLRVRMAQDNRLDAYRQVFGDRAVSPFISASERVGAVTSALTSRARAWRLGGYWGAETGDQVRFAAARERAFRDTAAKHGADWAKAFGRFMDEGADAAAHDELMRYMQGLTDDLSAIPDYLHLPAEQMRELYPELLELARRWGADVGDVTSNYARYYGEKTIEAAKQRMAQLKKQGESTDALQAEVDQLTAEVEGAAESLRSLDEYDARIQQLRADMGLPVGHVVGPKLYAPRRLTDAAWSALDGERTGRLVYQGRKTFRHELEQKLFKSTITDAEKQLRHIFGDQLANVDTIIERNPLVAFEGYVDDMAKAVRKAQLGRAADSLLQAAGGVDNGVVVRLVDSNPDQLASKLLKVQADRAAGVVTKDTVVADFLDEVEGSLTGKAVDDKTVVRKALGDLPDTQLRRLQVAAHELNRAKAKHALGDTPAQPPLVKDATDKRGWTKLDVPGLEDYWMHPFLAAEFNNAWKGVSPKTGLRAAWRKHLLGPWKRWATNPWPGFHMRNNYGAWFNNWLGGVGDTHYEAAWHVIRDVMGKPDHPLYGKVVKLGDRTVKVEGVELTYGMVGEMVQDLAIAGGNSLAIADIAEYVGRANSVVPFSSEKLVGKGVRSSRNVLEKWERLGVNTTTVTENFHRTAAFLKGLEDAAGDLASARAFVMMRHGDYEELTDFENNLRDILPFYKWIRTNRAFQLRTLVEQPGKQMAVLKAGRALVPDDERKFLPEYMKEGGFLIPKPGTKRGHGMANYLMLDLPLYDALTGASEFATEFFPIVRQFAETLLIKKNLFTGEPLEGAKREKLAEWADSAVAGPLGWVLDATGIAKRDADGDLTLSDRQLNILSVFPVFAKFRNFLSEDDNRKELRYNALLSTVSGVGYRPVGEQQLNSEEARFFHEVVEPVANELKALGYQLPSIDDIAAFGLQP